jgi:hypothetical protein
MKVSQALNSQAEAPSKAQEAQRTEFGEVSENAVAVFPDRQAESVSTLAARRLSVDLTIDACKLLDLA